MVSSNTHQNKILSVLAHPKLKYGLLLKQLNVAS